MPGGLTRAETRTPIHLLWLAVLLFVASWLIPDHYPPWQSFYNETAAFLGLWALMLFCALDPSRSAFVAPCWTLCLLGVVAIPLAQASSGLILFQGDVWMASGYISGFLLACATGHALSADRVEAAAGLVASTFLLGALLTAAITLYQAMGVTGLETWIFSGCSGNRACGNLAQPNHAASLMCLGLASLVYLWAKKVLPAPVLLAPAVLLILSTTLTQSRVAWLSAGFLVFWWLVKRDLVPRVKGQIICIVLVISAGLIIFWPLDAGIKLIPRVEQRTDLVQAGTHFQNWEEMLRAVQREPWLGYGWGQVTVAHVQNARARHTYAEMLSHSHNFFLDLLVWNGMPLGLLIIGGLLFWAGTRAWDCHTPESWFALLTIGLVGAHALFEYPLEYAYFLLPLGLLMGLVEADRMAGSVLAIPRSALWPVLAAFAFFMGWIWHEYRLVEADHRLMRFETRNIGPLKAEQLAPDIVLLTQLREDLRMARSQARENMSAEELEWMRRITYRYPWYSSLFRYSVSLALNGRQQEADIEFRRLYDIYGAKPYTEAKKAVQILADTRYPALQGWELPPP